jgi:hypothetical protein
MQADIQVTRNSDVCYFSFDVLQGMYMLKRCSNLELSIFDATACSIYVYMCTQFLRDLTCKKLYAC